MSFDPLSGATRSARRNLLAVSSVLICAKIFNVSFEKIPLSGVDIQFSESAALFCLCAINVYLAFEFISYYISDILNNDESSHEKKVMQDIEKRLSMSKSQFSAKIMNEICKINKENYDYSLNERILQGYYEGSERNCIAFILRKRRIVNDNLVLLPLGGAYGGSVAHGDFKSEQENNLFRSRRSSITKEQKEFLKISNEICERMVERYHIYYLWKIFILSVVCAEKMLFTMFRTYMFDGLIPVFYSVLSILCAYGVLDLGWVRNLGPA